MSVDEDSGEDELISDSENEDASIRRVYVIYVIRTDFTAPIRTESRLMSASRQRVANLLRPGLRNVTKRYNRVAP